MSQGFGTVGTWGWCVACLGLSYAPKGVSSTLAFPGRMPVASPSRHEPDRPLIMPGAPCGHTLAPHGEPLYELAETRTNRLKCRRGGPRAQLPADHQSDHLGRPAGAGPVAAEPGLWLVLGMQASGFPCSLRERCSGG